MVDITYALTDEAVMLEIGSRIKQKRIARQRKQSEMAESLGVSLPTYRRIEKGDMKFSLMVAVLRAFNELEALNILLPVAQASPMALLNKAAAPKQRVSRKRTTGMGVEDNSAKALMTRSAGNKTQPPEKPEDKGDDKW